MKRTKTLKVAEILADMESGLGDVPLMEKYGLSPEELRRVYEKLSDTEFFNAHGHRPRKTPARRAFKESDSRSLPRNHALVRVPVHDATSRDPEGVVIDITTQGLKIAGLKATPGEIRCLVIRSDLFLPGGPLSLNARCCWATADKDDAQLESGFQITDASHESMRQLRKLISRLTVR